MRPSCLTLAMTLTLNFQGQIWNFLHLSQKWSDCHETKSKHIDWTPGLRCDQWVWPWPCPWPLNFEGQMWPWPLLRTWSWPWIFMVKFWNSCISEWEGRLKLHKGGGSRSLMAMTMTIWWPRSGVWIYQIVTGVTSVVGVPSTHLVFIMGTPYTGKMASLYWIGLQILNPGYDRDCHLWGKISHGMLSALNPVGTDVNVQGYHWLSSFRLSSLPGTTIT